MLHVAIEVDGDGVLGASLLPGVAITQPVVRLLSLKEQSQREITTMGYDCNVVLTEFVLVPQPLTTRNEIIMQKSILSCHCHNNHMSTNASQISAIWLQILTVCSGNQHRKHQSSTLLALCEGNSWFKFILLTLGC